MQKITEVINHLFGDPQFARFAGTRSAAMLESALYKRVDAAHGMALSALDSNGMNSVDNAEDEVEADDGAEDGPIDGGSDTTEIFSDWSDADDDVQPACDRGVQGESSESENLEEVCDPDPSDETMTGAGDVAAILFALFVDGVQLHQNANATTTVVSLKCLDLPGFLSNTDLASFNLAFIGGKKEPTCMTEFMDLILRQFKEREPMGSLQPDGAFTRTSNPCPLLVRVAVVLNSLRYNRFS